MTCYPMVKKFEDMFIRFNTIHERDERTDGWTDIHRHRMTAKAALDAYTASRGKNYMLELRCRRRE